MSEAFDRRLSRRQVFKCAAGTAMGLLAGQLPARSSRADEDPPAPIRLRVLCYNIHHGEGSDGKLDLARQAEVIRAARPDLVTLQEVDNKTARTGGVDQTAELARLTGLHGRFGRQIDYEGGEYGQAILSRMPIRDLLIHVLPGDPPREQRIAVEARVRVASSEISLVSTHLHHISGEFRKQQAAKLNEIFNDPARPVILTGDFNAPPEAEPLQLLRDDWQLVEAKQPLLTYPAGEPTKPIDHILLRPRERFRTLSAEVIAEAVASDHRPLLAVIELRP